LLTFSHLFYKYYLKSDFTFVVTCRKAVVSIRQ
jgi:hypothetical protein